LFPSVDDELFGTVKIFNADKTTEISKDVLYGAYIEYTKTQRKQIIGKTAFLRKFYKLGGTVSRPRQDGKRVHIVSCPPLDRMRKRFKELYGKEIVD